MKLKNQKLIILGIICLTVIFSIIGYTYSFFTAEVEDKIVITGGSGTRTDPFTVS